MEDRELDELTLIGAARLIRQRELSPVELTEAVLGRIERLAKRFNVFIAVMAEAALEAARSAEKRVSAGEPLGALEGVPVSVKDLVDIRGVPTTAGSPLFADRLVTEDSTIVERLKSEGAILVGKTNMHELAYGVTSANVHFGPVRNPWDVSRVAGGSSGGSAVSVATSMSLGSIGTDTGGSIRIPAALCGTVGVKPTHGRVSGTGVIPLVECFDTFGPITRTVEDAALLLGVISGPDPRDSRTRGGPGFSDRKITRSSIVGVKLGIPRNVFNRTDPDVRKCVEAALDQLASMGAHLLEVEPEDPDLLEQIFRTIAGRVVFAFHRQYLEDFSASYGDDTRARIEAGQWVTDADYRAAEDDLSALRKRMADCFRRVDLLATPTVPIPAPDVGQKQVSAGGEDEPVLRALTRYTRLASIAGLPSISVPCGLTSGRLPVGLQLTGPEFGEEAVLRVAMAYESQSPRRLPIVAVSP